MKFFKTFNQWLGKKLIKKTDPSSQPITNQIIQWLKKNHWLYHYGNNTNKQSNDLSGNSQSTHHLIVPFEDKDFDWNCVFYINEKSQIISIYGMLSNTVPKSYFAPALMLIATSNLSIPFGNLELDPTNGELRAKIAFDAEFTALNDDVLNCHIKGLGVLTKLAFTIFQEIQQEEPSLLVLDYLPLEESTNVNDEFFEPTQQHQ